MILSRVEGLRCHGLRIACLMGVLVSAPCICFGAVYRCEAEDGSKTFSDTPCAADAQIVQSESTNSARARKPASGATLVPTGRAGVNETLEKIALQCETSDYKNWFVAQSPKPGLQDRVAKLKEITRKCRAVLPFQHASSSDAVNSRSAAVRLPSIAQAVPPSQTAQPLSERAPQAINNGASDAPPVNNPDTSAKEHRAREVLTMLNKQAIEYLSARNLKERAQLMAPYFLKKLDPRNSDWNKDNPKWKTMAAIVEKNLAEEISDKPTKVDLNIEAVFIREYAAKMSDSDLQTFAAYLATPEGKRYAAFQTQVEMLYDEGIRSLQANLPAPQEPVSDATQKRRLQLLALANSSMITVAQYEIAKNQQADISGFAGMPILLQAVATYKGAELDLLARRYAMDVAGFVAFSQMGTAKDHFAAMATAQSATVPLFTAELEEFASRIEAKRMAQWQQAYQDKVQKPTQTSIAADAARRATRPMPKAGTNFRECLDCPEMVVVPAGAFDMGSSENEVGRPDKQNVNRGRSEGPIHRVQVSSFAIGKFEVTRAQFSAFTRETGYGGIKGDWPQTSEFHQDGNHPVVNINAADADAYVNWLARKTGQPYRLPTEAEWEYAARANTTTSHYWGNDIDSICQYANIFDETAKKEIAAMRDLETVKCADGFAYTAPVGSFKPNAFGLYDMLGNASEIVADCSKTSNYDGAPTDASVVWVPSDCPLTTRGVPWHNRRGGSWRFGAEEARAASRDGTGETRESFSGLRVARSLP